MRVIWRIFCFIGALLFIFSMWWLHEGLQSTSSSYGDGQAGLTALVVIIPRLIIIAISSFFVILSSFLWIIYPSANLKIKLISILIFIVNIFLNIYLIVL
jgi:hypothetical protein